MVTTRCGPPEVVQLREIPAPAPAKDEVLIKMYASSVNPLDGYMIRGLSAFLPFVRRLCKPKYPIAGADVAGRVEAVGDDVKRFRPGDEVFGASFSERGMGGFAEYVCAVEDCLARKPANLSFDEAAAVPVAGITALQGLRDKGLIQPGQKILIDGASGGVGTFALQIARAFGAEVTAVCSPRNVERAHIMGAQHVIDYTQEDFTRNELRYDLILGANCHHSIFDYLRALKPGGIFVMVGGSMLRILQAVVLAPLLSRMGSKQARFFIAKINANDIECLSDLLEAGKVVPVIDRRYPLEQTADAMRYLEERHAQGKVVITICS